MAGGGYDYHDPKRRNRVDKKGVSVEIADLENSLFYNAPDGPVTVAG